MTIFTDTGLRATNSSVFVKSAYVSIFDFAGLSVG